MAGFNAPLPQSGGSSPPTLFKKALFLKSPTILLTNFGSKLYGLQHEVCSKRVVLVKDKGVRALFAYSTIGLQLAITILVFIYAGYKLDIYYKTSPWFVVAGTAIGMTAGFYNLFRGLSSIEKFSKKENEEKEIRKKWL